MSQQAKILTQMHQLVMGIIQSGTATPEQSEQMDELEELLEQQNCFKKVPNSKQANQGEVVASLFFNGEFDSAMDKMCEYKISPDDFFGFVQYHYDDEHEDEDKVGIFTSELMQKIYTQYQQKCQA